MNFSHINFSNNFVSMHQFSSATKVVGNVQPNISFIPATSAQHYQSQTNSNHVNYHNNVQVATAVIQQHYQEPPPRVLHHNVSSPSANTTLTTTTATATAAQTHWTNEVDHLASDGVKINLSNYPRHATQDPQLSQTIQRPSRTVIMQSVSTMTDFDSSPAVPCKTNQRDSSSSDCNGDGSKTLVENDSVLKYPCSNSCAKIDLKNNATAMAEYLNRLQPLSIPQHIQEFLKRENVKVLTDLNKTKTNEHKEDLEESDKCKPEVRMSTALDGSMLYCCSLCHMAYPHRDLLEQHHSVHKGERKYECNVCGVCLKRKEHLDQHKRGHSEERPFVCEICSKGFKRNEHLRRHIVIHSGDKSHVCTVCMKAFSRKDHLSKHLQIHVGKRVKSDLVEPTSPDQLHNNHKLVISN